MSTDGSDELARTATAAAASSPQPGPAEPIGQTIGRYRLERELGVGGMGVVHVAFDSDFERRVALKVLRGATGEEAAKRLQREARAMARLNHPNVVTVHEVGSAGGRDYVAMELIEGESLAEWLRASRREPRAVVDAFLAAGRGLAAAHAAGIVHRDFKPHNVLRSRAGRIAVTDFGLAREAARPVPSDPLAVTLPLGASSSETSNSANTPSSLSGLTVSGSVLGTPAYMAPEQWSGGEVTPATDQFGFCVALWEALSGERPYRGPTVDDLRAQVAAGPSSIDASRIPRRLRAILRRGLDPDRARRWPSMDVLLARLARAERGTWIAVTALGAGVLAAGVLIVVLRGRSGAAACPAPALDPSAVWPDNAVATMTALGQGPATKLFATDIRSWKEIRGGACAAEPAQRLAALACLDGVLARFDVVMRAASGPNFGPIDVGSALIDPAICAGTSLPRLLGVASPQLQEVITARLRGDAGPDPSDEVAPAALAQRVGADPCAAALAQAHLAEVAKEGATQDCAAELAEQAANSCLDDRIRAELAISVAGRALNGEPASTKLASKLARAEAAVQRVPQADSSATIASYRVLLDANSERYDQAIADGQAAVAGFAQRGRIAAQIRAGLHTLRIRETRARPDDVATIASTLDSLRALGQSELGAADPVLRAIEIVAARWAWTSGDLAGAHARLQAVFRTEPIDGARHVRGTVVDSVGAPVAGATVVTGQRFFGDSISVIGPSANGKIRSTTTAADGTFDLPEAVPEGVAVAQLGDRRSLAVALADTVRLVLAPTSRLSGHVDLGRIPASKVIVQADLLDDPTRLYATAAPVAADGTFTLDGVPRVPINLIVLVEHLTGQTVSLHRLDVTQPVVSGIALAPPSSRRMLTVLVRSTVGAPTANAQVVIVPGTQPSVVTARDFQNKVGTLGGATVRFAEPFDATAHPEAKAASRPGDLVAAGIPAPDGVTSACAIGLPANITEPSFVKAVTQHQDKIEMHCVPVAPDANVAIIEVPPWPRFD